MEYGFVHLSLAPLRAAPSDRAEMVSQLLFGEAVEVLREESPWLQVRNAADRYEGWMDGKQCTPLSFEEYAVVAAWPRRAALPITTVTLNGSHIAVPMGSPLPAPSIFCMGSLTLQRAAISPQGKTSAGSAAGSAGSAGKAGAVASAGSANSPQRLARQLIHAPYLWGGKSLMGIDCSGLTQVAFAVCGIQLPRNAAQQALTGTPVATVDMLQPNDLCFFSNPNGQIIHVGIYLGNGQIIHASGSVRIDRLDAEGIYNAPLRRHTHHLHSMRRVF